MTKQEETLHKVYDGIPDNVPSPFDIFGELDETIRLLRLKYLRFIRFFTR